MHRYEELEKKYYKKLYLKIIFYSIIIVGVILIIFITNINNKDKPEKKSFKEKNTTLQQINKETNISIKKIKTAVKKEHKNKNIPKKTNKNITEKIKFILPDIENITPLNNENYESNISNKNNRKTKPLKKTENNISKKPVFNLKEISLDKQDIKVLVKNFNQNPDYDLAITIAKYYLNYNNLKKAQIWALKANNLNPEKADSWIIFANILQRENKIQKAIEILKVYKDSYGVDKKIEKKLRSLYAK